MNTSAVRHLSFFPFVQALARPKARFLLEAAAGDLASCELVWWKRSAPEEKHTVPLRVSISNRRRDKWAADVFIYFAFLSDEALITRFADSIICWFPTLFSMRRNKS